jgi:regulatory protein
MTKHSPDEPYSYERAWNYVLWLLGRRNYTRVELRRRLTRKGATEETVARVLERLERLNLVDDAAFAKSYVRLKRHNKGPRALHRELRQKGVPEVLTSDALAAVGEDEQREAAHTLLEKNAWRWKGDARKRKAKAYAFLLRRGFAGEVVIEALEASGLFEAE